MNANELMQAVKVEFERHHESWLEFVREAEQPDATGTAKRRGETYRRIIEHQHKLFESKEFKKLSIGFLKARVPDPATKVVALIEWLDSINALTKSFDPKELSDRTDRRVQAQRKLVEVIRDTAATFPEEREMELRELADEIEQGISFTIRAYDAGGIGRDILSRDRIAKAGTPAWSTWLIRELVSRLPALEHFRPNEYAMVAGLLTWAKFPVDSKLVRVTFVDLPPSLQRSGGI